MPHEINHFRRRLFTTAATTLAARRLGVFEIAHAQSGSTVQGGAPGTRTSFASLKQVNAGSLNVGYAEDGPAMVLSSSFCTAGRMTFTPMSTLRRCWRPGVTV